MKNISLLFLVLVITACTPQPAITPTPITHEGWGSYFEAADVEGCFLLLDEAAGQTHGFNAERCQQAFLPASTFKILNALIALETGIAPDENYLMEWDGIHNDVDSWNQDHTLQSAFQNSVVWYFQALARQVGSETMQQWVSATQYGNEDISGKLDSFWLDGGLRITAEQQIDFLRRFAHDELPFSDRSMTIVKKMMIVEIGAQYTLRAKTGTVTRVGDVIGWYVGWVQRGEDVYYFAMNITPNTAKGDVATARLEITHQILSELGLVE